MILDVKLRGALLGPSPGLPWGLISVPVGMMGVAPLPGGQQAGNGQRAREVESLSLPHLLPGVTAPVQTRPSGQVQPDQGAESVGCSDGPLPFLPCTRG